MDPAHLVREAQGHGRCDPQRQLDEQQRTG
jgi:hypothetical protein